MKNLISIILTLLSLFNTIKAEDTLRIRVYLEGPMINNGNAFAGGFPLMRDNLRKSPFTDQRYIPAKSPYTHEPFFLYNESRYGIAGPQFDVVTDSVTVFDVTGSNAIVDWVFVEVRSATNHGHVKATRSALLQRDGDVVSNDGVSPLLFPSLIDSTGYIVIKHRNHLAVMSQVVDFDDEIDFTSPSFPTFNYGTSMPPFNYATLSQNRRTKIGFMTMWAGDFDSDGKIKSGNPGDDMNELFYGVITHTGNPTGNSNFDSGYGYLPMDFDMNSKSKFDNPNDDKNMHFVQTILYPLNSGLLDNFNHFIEQVPPVTIRD